MALGWQLLCSSPLWFRCWKDKSAGYLASLQRVSTTPTRVLYPTPFTGHLPQCALFSFIPLLQLPAAATGEVTSPPDPELQDSLGTQWEYDADFPLPSIANPAGEEVAEMMGKQVRSAAPAQVPRTAARTVLAAAVGVGDPQLHGDLG